MNPLAHDLAWTLIHFLWQGTLIALGAKLVLALLHRHSADLRYAVALLALLAMAGSVVVTFVHRRTEATPVPVVTGLPDSGWSARASSSAAALADEGLPGAVTTPNRRPQKPSGAISPGAFDWKRGIAIAWLVGVALLSAWRLIGLFGIARLRRGATAVPEALAGEFERLRASMRVTRRAAVRLSTIARVPIVVGTLRPLVLVPTAALAGLTPDQLRAILAHELAHIRRGDFLVNLIQTALETLLFFHPAVWWIAATIRRERENSCDDIAVATCQDKVVYARALGELAEMLHGSTTPLAMAAAGRGRGDLSRRIRRLLDPGPVPRGSGWWSAALLSLVVIIAGATRQASQADPEEPTGRKPAARGQILDRQGRVLARNGDAGREYPFGALAAQVLGYTRDGEGLVGVEKSGQAHLDSAADLRLTLDLEKQFIAEKALREARIGRGSVVVVDPSNGEVVAMASVPSYDPNTFVPAIKREDFDALRSDPTRPLFNRNFGSYPPGSTFKCLTALTMERTDRHFACDGHVDIEGFSFKCWNRKGHGELTLSDALMHSCNCYFYQAGIEAGMESIHDTATRFGFGSKTGVELPSEPSGLIPNEAYLRKRDRKPGPSQVAQLAIGQGLTSATPLQMAMLAATIGNGGTRHNPHLFLARDRAKPVTVEGIDEEVLALVRKAMWRVVNAPEGTGRSAQSELITIAGKTGTSQWVNRGHSEFVGLFTGFAPSDEPRYAITVLVENARSGGTVCAPLARKILEAFTRIDAGEKVTVVPLAPAMGHLDLIE